MRGSYIKISIYVLTFLAYAYSGYGYSTIVHLRDALIAAEAIFGDVFQNMIVVVKKLRFVHELFNAAVDEKCIFTCPKGEGPEIRPVQNKLYKPTSDGCGSWGLRVSTDYLPAIEMEPCCNAHDICYDTCNNDKELCDMDFKRCLYKFCDSYEKSIVSDLMIKGCKGAANVLVTGTLTLGCKSYLDSQKRSCYCTAPKMHYKTGNAKNTNGKYQKGNKQKYGWKDPTEM